MGSNSLMDNPYAALTFISAPALLTNASCVLAMSTINRLLRTRESMRELWRESERKAQPRGPQFIAKVNRVERQASVLLRALHFIYVALGAFAAATLVTLLGAVAGQLGSDGWMHVGGGAGLLLGVVGVAGMIGGCANLFHATQLSLISIREEANSIRARQDQLKHQLGDSHAS
jgi:hypothetical protein